VGRRFETDFKNNSPNSVIELISLKKGPGNGFCNICGAAAQNYGGSGSKLSLKEDAWEFFNLLMSAKKNQGTVANAISNISSIDTTPKQVVTNDKGYYIGIKDNKGNCTVVVEDKNRKEVKRLLLTEWNKNEKYHKELYGEIPSSPKNNDIKKTDTNPENEEVLIKATIGDYLFTAQTIIVKDKRRNGGLDSVSVINFPSGANDLSLTDFNGLVLVNGIEVAGEELKKIKPDEIVEISIYKSKSALKEYGEKGKNGVIIISTKKQVTDNPQTSVIEIRGKANIADNAVYYVNGKETSKEAVELIDPAKIQSINVLKGNPAEQKYGEKGKNGVVEITITGSANSNFIEKPITPAWDTKNFLPGKKKDEC